MIFIMGFASIVSAICCLFPGGESCWLETQMHHAAWDGLRHHDTIFPLFLFIAGISFPFSYAKQVSKGSTRGKIYGKIFRRALVLFLLGLVYNGFFKLKFPTLRIFSVLARIGFAWMFAALLFINLPDREGRAGRSRGSWSFLVGREPCGIHRPCAVPEPYLSERSI